MAEFLIALFPVMLAFLGFTQFCFMAIAKLAVQHSAVLAARAAVVVIEEADGVPGAPVNVYEGFPAGGLELSPAKDADAAGQASQTQAAVGGVSQVAAESESTRQTMDGLLGSYERTSSRIKQIRTAAYWPLLAISPSVVEDGVDIASTLSNSELFPKMRVRSAIGESDSTRILGAFLYNLGAVAVTFPTGLGAAQLRSDGEFAPDELITTRVTYLFRCQVPFVSAIMCASGWALMLGDAWVDPFLMRRIAKTVGQPPQRVQDMPGWVDNWMRAEELRTRMQQRVDAFTGREQEFAQVEWPFMLDVLLAWPGSRYVVMSAEAALPAQGAKYYPRVSDEDMKHMVAAQNAKQQSGSSLPNVREVLTPLGDAVSSAAQAVSSGMTKVTEAGQKIIDARDEALNTLREKSQAAVGAVKDVTDERIGELREGFAEANAALTQGAENLGTNVGSAAGGVVKAAVSSDLAKQAASGAKQVINYADDAAEGVRDKAGELASDVKALGKEAPREARKAAGVIMKAGGAYAKDVENAGARGSTEVQNVGSGFASELLGGGASSGRSSSTSARKPSRRSSSNKNPGSSTAADDEARGEPADAEKAGVGPRGTPDLGLDQF
jgi:hypothetical protein